MKLVTRRGALAALVIGVTVPRPGSAQDTHYWTHQYGTRGNLLTGAVIGSAVDISATYYNPGSLALIDSPELFLTGKVFELNDVSITGERDVIDLNQLQFRIAPGFFGGTLPFAFLGGHDLAYSIFTRQLFSLRLDSGATETGDFDPSRPGEEDIAVKAQQDANLHETWIGITWAAKFARELGFGATLYVANRSQRGRAQLTGQLLDAQGSAAISAISDDYSYYDWSLLAKVGLATEVGRLSLGITLTTPRLHLFGGGSKGRNTTVLGQDLDGDGIEETIIIADYQSGVSAKYLSPVSVGAGASYGGESWALYFSTEWFNSLDEYRILDTDPFVGQSSGDTLQNNLTQALEAVLNFGAGVEKSFGERFKGYASFSTDYSAAASDDGGNLGVTKWNLYHITAGAWFRVSQAAFTVGVGYGFSGAQDLPSFDDAGINSDGRLFGALNNLDAEFVGLKLILGFEYGSLRL